MGFAAENVLVVGDSFSKDVVPAKAVGCRVAWLKGEGWGGEVIDESVPRCNYYGLGSIACIIVIGYGNTKTRIGEKGLFSSFCFSNLFVLFLWGFAHAILDVLNKHFQEVMDITRTHSAMVQVMFYLGYFIMAIPAGLFITKYGYRKGVVFGLLLYGIGSLMFIPGEYWMSFEFFLFSLFVIACGLVFFGNSCKSLYDRTGGIGKQLPVG